jgi:hypothetical protein
MSEFPLSGDPDRCPYLDCDADLRGEPIPEESRHLYGGATHFKRELVCEVRGVYDGGLYYICRDCGRPYHRWPVGSFQHQAAVPYMRQTADAARHSAKAS